MTWDTEFQSLYLHFYSRKDAFVSDLKSETRQVSYSDVCPCFVFINLFGLLYICIWKTILADLTFKKIVTFETAFYKSTVQRVVASYVCRYIHIYIHEYPHIYTSYNWEKKEKKRKKWNLGWINVGNISEK